MFNALKIILKNTRTVFVSLCIMTLLVTYASQSWGQSPFDGAWRINLEETDKVIEKFEEDSGLSGNGINTSVSIMGLPLPSRYRQSSMSSLPAKDPKVLLCTDTEIQVDDQRVLFIYDGNEEEILRKGDYRGRQSKWSKKKIEQKYKTPERSVRKTWTLRKDGRLLVSVKIDPRNYKARTYNRVFDRLPQTP